MSKKAMLIYLDDELKDWVKTQAEKDNRNMSNWIVAQLLKLKEEQDNERED